MADVTEQLVLGSYTAVKRPAYSTEVVRTDSGSTFRNSRWGASLATWDVSIPACKRNSAWYLAAIALFAAVKGSAKTFTFHDPVACADVEACIVDDSLSITPSGNLVQVEFAVEEYR